MNPTMNTKNLRYWIDMDDLPRLRKPGDVTYRLKKLQSEFQREGFQYKREFHHLNVEVYYDDGDPNYFEGGTLICEIPALLWLEIVAPLFDEVATRWLSVWAEDKERDMRTMKAEEKRKNESGAG